MKLFLTLLVCGLAFVASQDPCAGCADECINEIYVGFPLCADKIKELKDAYDVTEEPPVVSLDYVGAGYTDGDICSFQSFFANMPVSDGTEHHCPDPTFSGEDELMTVNDDGSVTFRVYRVTEVYDEDGEVDVWGVRLLNANAANMAGVLGYAHVEVIPNDMREPEDVEVDQRKWGYDNIIVFEVTVKNPQDYQDTYGQMLGPFSAMDSGVCTGGDSVCNFETLGGFGVGVQDQVNPRHAYEGGKWFSFPQCGFCDHPTGEPECTYNYKVVGMYHLDDLSFPVQCDDCEEDSGPCQTGSYCEEYDPTATDAYPPTCRADAAVCDQETIHTWFAANKTEHERVRAEDLPNGECGAPAQCTDGASTNEAACEANDGIWAEYGVTIAGRQFWYYPCDERMCRERVLKLVDTPLDPVLARAGEGPNDRYCVTGYLPDTAAKEWDPDSDHIVVDAADDLLSCAAECDIRSNCVAFAWMDGSVADWESPCVEPNYTDEESGWCMSATQCRIYKFEIQPVDPPAWLSWDGCSSWDGCVYNRMTMPEPTPPTSEPPTVPVDATTAPAGNGTTGTGTGTGPGEEAPGPADMSGVFAVLTPTTGPLFGALFSALAAAFVFA